MQICCPGGNQIHHTPELPRGSIVSYYTLYILCIYSVILNFSIFNLSFKYLHMCNFCCNFALQLSNSMKTNEYNGAEQIRQMCAQAQHMVVVTHMSPDGDALGSALGVKHSVQADCTVIVPNGFPDFLAWMPGAQDILIYDQHTSQADAAIQAADMIVCTDFHELKRIGALGLQIQDKLNTCPTLPLAVIDHHIVCDEAMSEVRAARPYAEVIDSASPSASEIVYRIFRLGMSDSRLRDAATCIYAGMMTDTGNFSFNSNRPEMYEIIGQLVAAGVDKDEVYNRVFNMWSADRMRLVGYCLNRKMQLFPEYHLALIYLTRKELYRYNFHAGDAEGIVNMPLQIKDVYYSCFMREDKVLPHELERAAGEKIKVKISLRSQGDRPVNILAHDIFFGGGHKNAAGGEFYGPVAKAVEQFLRAYPQYLQKD